MREKIKQIMESKGVSNYSLSKTTGIHESTIGRFINGVSSISVDNLNILCDALGFELSLKKAQ